MISSVKQVDGDGVMAKAELKTKENDGSVDDFMGSIDDETKRDDSRKIAAMMERISGEPPRMWGTAIIGFGKEPLKYASGRELDWPKIAFSPRKANITLYLTCNASEYADTLARFGKHTTGKGCIYIKQLADIDEKVLEKLVKASLKR